MANDAPAFQLYAKDFLSDPFVDVMTPEQLGGYFRLLLLAWQQSDPGYLPGDDRLLAEWSKLRRRWPLCRGAILCCFRTAEDGRIYQKRMVEIAAEMAARRHARATAGRAGGVAKAALGSRIGTNSSGTLDRAKLEALTGQVVENSENDPGNATILPVAKRSSSSSSASASSDLDPGSLDPDSGRGALPGTALALFEPVEPAPKKRTKGEEFEPLARQVLDFLNAARRRVIPGARDLAATPSNLHEIRGRLAEGYSAADCMHVVEVCEAEVRRGDDPKWFDPVTPFRSSNFPRRVGAPVPGQVKPLALSNGRSESAPRHAEEYHPPWLPREDQ